MASGKLLRFGVIGTVVTALCCFTPVLAVGLGALGLSGLLIWADLVLLPMLGLFVGVVAYALIRRPRYG